MCLIAHLASKELFLQCPSVVSPQGPPHPHAVPCPGLPAGVARQTKVFGLD